MDKDLGRHIFLDALASLELDTTLSGSQIFREILVNKLFVLTDLHTLQSYNLTTLKLTKKEKKTKRQKDKKTKIQKDKKKDKKTKRLWCWCYISKNLQP